MIKTGFESRIKIQQIVNNQFPDFVRNENPEAIDFLKQYYISQEYQGGPTDISDNLDQYLKIDNLTSDVIVDNSTTVGIVTVGDKTINANSTKGFPDQYGLLKIDDEIITYTQKTSSSFTGCVRGFSGITSYHDTLNKEELVFSTSSISSHNSGSKIQNLSSLFLQEFYKKQKYTFTPGLEGVDFTPDLNAGNFIKEARSLYEAKGTDESFRLLFNVLYGETPKVVNLEEFLIKPSSADYVRRQIIIAEVLNDGNPKKLIGQAIFKESDSDINASVSEVEPFTRVGVALTENRNYYKISLFLGHNEEETFIQGNFEITPASKSIENVSIGSSVITVDSTVGFGETGNIASGNNANISYTSKSINQFFGCDGILSPISSADNVRSVDVYYGYENDTNNKVELRLTGILSKFKQVSKNLTIDENQIISVDSIGDLIKNPSQNRTYKEIFANSWIYNTSVRYKATISNTAEVLFETEIDRSSLKRGDLVEILNPNSNIVIETRIIEDDFHDPNRWWYNKSKKIQLSGSSVSGKYDIRRKINNAASIGSPLQFDKIVSDVQNLYVENDKTAYVASNSIPSGRIGVTTDFVTTINIKVKSTVAAGLTQAISEPNQYSAIEFDQKVPFVTGDAVYYETVGDYDNYVGIDTGLYYVGIVSTSPDKKQIRLYSTPSFIGGRYLTLKPSSGLSTETGHKFTLNSQSNNVIGPQKILKKFSLETSINRGDQVKTEPGSVGMLINGVEISNYKSNDRIYYGPLESLDILNSGSEYDLLNLPKIDISTGLGVTALVQPVVKGSIKNILVDRQPFNIKEVVSIGVEGGNGNAILEVLTNEGPRDIEFDARTTTNSGGINTTTDTITFLTDHYFHNYQEIIYNSIGNNQISVGYGKSTLVDYSSYFVNIIDSNTVKLYQSESDSRVGINTVGFGTTGFSGVQKFSSLSNQISINGIKVIDGGEFTNRKLIVKPIGISTEYDTVTFKNHGFSNGDKIVYSTDGTSISGLLTTNQYNIIKVDDDSFRLADAGIGGTISSNFARKDYVSFGSTGSGYQNFAYPDVLVSLVYSPVGFGTTTQTLQQLTLTPEITGSIIDTYLYESGSGYGSTIINFQKKPIISIKSGKDARVNPLISNGRIDNFNIQYGGSEYYSLPKLEIVDNSGKGSGAELRPIITNNRLTDIKIINPGIGYSSTDTTIKVVTAGKHAKFDVNIRPLTIDLNQIYGDQVLLNNEYNDLQYSICGYGQTLRNSFNEIGIGETYASKIIGWAYDGNPIYGPYGYSDPNNDNKARRLLSGYEKDLSYVEDRPVGFDLGYFVEDYKFTNSGDLDRNNGRYGKTPEFPDGVYAYFATIEDPTTNIPQFPYFIGDSYRSIPVDQTIDQSFDFNNSNLIRNTFPYRVNNQYTDSDFIIETNEITRQKSVIESVTSGGIDELNIISVGNNYKINDNLIFDNTDTNGNGLSANVSSLKGKSVTRIDTSRLEYNDSVFTWIDYKRVKVTTPIKHDFSNKDNVLVSGFSTNLSQLNGSHIIGFNTFDTSLQSAMPSQSAGVSSEIYVSTIPSTVSVGSSIQIGSETLKILSIFKNKNILKVERGSGAAHTTTSKISYLPDSFIINKSLDYFNSPVNNKVYFNPIKSVGLGTLSGISSSVTFDFAGVEIVRDIPTKSIYIENHPFEEDQEILLTNAGSSIKYSDESMSPQHDLPTTLYVSNINNNSIGIKTVLGNSDVYFRSGGADDDRYLLESNFSQIKEKVERITTQVSISTLTPHNLKSNDIISLSVEPNLTVGIGTSVSVSVERQSNTGFILINPIGFSSSGINTLTNEITIDSHGLKTGDKITYSADENASGLTTGNYYVYKVDEDNIKFCNTLVDAQSNPPLSVGVGTTIGGNSQLISLINPQLNIIKTNSLVFDLSHSSLEDYKFKLYYDKEFKNEFVSVASTTFNIVSVGTIGVSTNATITLDYNINLPDNLYYNLEKSGGISTTDKEVLNYSEINLISSLYNSNYKIIGVGVGNTNFDISLSSLPEKLSYDQSECNSLSYNTNALNENGGIDKVDIISSGVNYKKLPVFVGSSSTEGSGALIVAQSQNVGNANKVRIINEGFEYSSDKTLKPKAYISPLIIINNSNTIGVVTITDGGDGYLNAPNISIINSTTREKINSGLLESKLSGSSISHIDITVLPKGLPDIPVELFTYNNSNGIGIQTVQSNSTGIFTCWISTPSTGFTISPFDVDDEVFIEGITRVGTAGSGFNSEDYGYKFGKVIDVIAGLSTGITIDLSGISDNTGIAVTNQNSLATIINKKNYPTFDVSLKPSKFIIGEKIITDKIERDLSVTNSENDSIKVSGTYTLNVGDTILGKNSGTLASIVSITNNLGEYDVSFSVKKDIGWSNDIGKLDLDTQVTPDNDYYQNLSYTIKSSQTFEQLRSPVSSLLHTSGLKNFADLGITSVTSNVGVSTDVVDSFNTIISLSGENRVDTINNYDTAVDLSTDNITSKFVKFDSKVLSNYLQATSNQVISIDNINKQFSNLETSPLEYLDFFKIEDNTTFSNLLLRVSNIDSTDIQSTELVILNNGSSIILLNKDMMNDENHAGIGSFIIDSSLDATYLRFFPLPNAYDYDYDIKVIDTSFKQNSGIGTESIGFIDLIGTVGIATTSTNSGVTTTSIVSLDKENYSSIYAENQLINRSTNEMNYVELYTTHDNSDTYISEYFVDTHNQVSGYSDTIMGSFNGIIDGSLFTLNYENDLSDKVEFRSNIVGFGTTTVGIQTYRFKTIGQPDGTERSALYQSNYNVGVGITDVVALDSQLFNFVKSTVEVSTGSTKALYKVSMTHNYSDTFIQIGPFLSINTGIAQTGIGTFGGQYDANNFILKFYPDDAYNTDSIQVSSLNKIFYTDMDDANVDIIEDLEYGKVTTNIDNYYYNAINGERINRKNFTLTENNIPIFAKHFNPDSSVGVVSYTTGLFSIDDHFFRTGEELIYTPKSTFVGIGSTAMQYSGGAGTKLLPSSVFAIRNDKDSFYLSTTRADADAGTSITFVNPGEGNSHELAMKLSNTKSVITINNIIQPPLAYVPISYTLENNGDSILGSTGINTTRTFFTLSGISSINPSDLLKIDDEYMNIINVGFGTTTTGPITGAGTSTLIEVERGFVGTSATAHINSSTVNLYRGAFNIVGEEIHFTNAPRGSVSRGLDESNLEWARSDFSGRVFFRNNYDTNQIYDNISEEFTGIGQTFNITVGGANTAGIGTTGGSGLVLVNRLYQKPSAPNNPSNNYQFTDDIDAGITTITFSGIRTDTGDIFVSDSDVNQNELPRGGVIVSLGSTPGLGYAPLVGAIGFLEQTNGVVDKVVSTASTGAPNSITTASYNNETGVLEIQTEGAHNFEAGIVNQVKLAGLEFTCSGSFNVYDAAYDQTTGDLELTVGDHYLGAGQYIEIKNNSLNFKCEGDNYVGLHAYPRAGTDPIAGIPTAINSTSNSTITINVGVGTTNPHVFVPDTGIHKFVSAGINSITADTTAQFTAATGTEYNPITGDLVLEIGSHTLDTSNTITMTDDAITFTCDADSHATEHKYPRATDPASGQTLAITNPTSTTITVNVGAVQGVGAVIVRSGYSGTTNTIFPYAVVGLGSTSYDYSVISVGSTNIFTTKVGVNSIPHTYVGGGSVMPWYGNANSGSGYLDSNVSIGVTDIAYDHKFISATNTSINGSIQPNNVVYDPYIGTLTLSIPNHGLSGTLTITDNSLTFTCSKDNHATEHTYPRSGIDPASGSSLPITVIDDNTLSVDVGSSVGTGAIVSGQVGLGGTITFSLDNGGSNYNNPQLVVSQPVYENIPIVGVSRLSSGQTTDCGTGLLLNLDVGAASTVGVGSTLFAINDFKIARNGYGFKRGDVFKPVGLVTDKSLSSPLESVEFTVLDSYSDSFASWEFGQFDYIDSIKNLQDGQETRFELRYNEQLLSFEEPDSNSYNVKLENCLFIIINGVIQIPGKDYQFSGGTSFVFSSPPRTVDDVAIFFYRGTSGLDTQLITNIRPSIKTGDLIRLVNLKSQQIGISSTKNQQDRTITSIKYSDVIETNLYKGPGISSESKALDWTKQKVDKIIDGDIVYKSRDSLQTMIFPTSKIIDSVTTTSNEIFVDNVDLFDYDSPVSISGLVIEGNNPVAAAITAVVSIAGTISSLDVVSGGSGYVGTTTDIIIGSPYGVSVGGTWGRTYNSQLGISTFAEAVGNITNGSITSVDITNIGLGYTQTSSPNVLAPLPEFKKELVSNITNIQGFSGIVTGIGTTAGVGTDLALKFHLHASNYNNLLAGYPISISDTEIGTGVTSLYPSGIGIVGIGTTFLNNVYRIAQISHTGNSGLVTCNIESPSDALGIGTSGSQFDPVGTFSWGRLSGASIRSSSPISIGVTGLTIDAGLTTFPTITRRGVGLRDTGSIDA